MFPAWAGMPTPEERVDALRLVILGLPIPNRETLVLLFSHLHRCVPSSQHAHACAVTNDRECWLGAAGNRVAEAQAVNKMSEQNLGTVFGPTLFSDAVNTDSMTLGAIGFGSGNDVVEQLLLCWPYLF